MGMSRRVGRPKEDDSFSLNDLIGENGEPKSGYLDTKANQIEDFAREVNSPPAERTSTTRGMYAGETNPENFLEFYKTSVGKKLRGRPWKYPTREALQKEVMGYFEFCIDRRIAVTVAGLSAWLGISVATLRLWRQNQDTQPFYDVVEPAVAFIHSMMEQGAMDGLIPSVVYIFASKNYFGLQDKMEYSLAPRDTLTNAEQQEIIDSLPE